MIKFSFPILLLLIACNTSSKPINETTPQIDKNEFLKDQVLLTNYAFFKGGRQLYGASAFLINYNNGVYAVTAKHLIGEAGGVSPEIKQTKLKDELLSWQMFPRVAVRPSTDTVTATVGNLDYAANESDALLLKTVGYKGGIKPLVPSFTVPVVGDTLYLIGCPYSEKNCKQNIYTAVFIGVPDEDSMLVSEIFFHEKIAGFSGAPLVNNKGEVVAVLYGGGEDNGRFFIYCTPIKAILAIKER